MTASVHGDGFAMTSVGAGVWRIDLQGDWRTGQRSLDFAVAAARLPSDGSVRAVEFVATELTHWNTGLLAWLLGCEQWCRDRQVVFQVEGLPEGLRRLIRLAGAVPERQGARKSATAKPVLEQIGESVLAGRDGLLAVVEFVGGSLISCGRLLTGRARFRWSDTLLLMRQCGPQALGIVALINFLVGVILAFVGAVQLTQFGASVYVADMVAIAMVREMGCIMTGFIMCGRTGAAFAAQLGTMKVNEELDAYRTFGFPPMDFLVLPRLLALVLMMPLLCTFADFIGILGGFMVSTMMLDVSATEYWLRTVDVVNLRHFLLGVGKGVFFGWLVALAGCLRGMQCGNNAAAVGEATTSAVVAGITCIVAADGIFAVLCHVLGI